MIQKLIFIIFIYLNYANTSPPGQPTPQTEIIVENFREMSISIRDVATLASDIECDKMYAKIEAPFLNNPLTLKMACLNKDLRLDMVMNDYLENPDSIFIDNFNFKVTIQQEDNNGVKTDKISVNKDLQVQANHEDTLSKIESPHTLIVYIIFRCHGYDGYNCNYKVLSNPKYARDQATGNAYCVQSGNCDDQTCERSKCNNKGQCYIHTFDDTKFYCVCDANRYGETCENEYVAEFEEELLLFAPQEQLPSATDETNCATCNNQNCKKYGDFRVCHTAGSITTPCTGNCVETCGERICLRETVTLTDGADSTEYTSANKVYFMKSLIESQTQNSQ